MFGQLRTQWIDIISNYQEWDAYNDSFLICELHFPEQSFIVEKGRKTLKREALPNFPIHEIEFVGINESTHIDEHQNEEFVSVVDANRNETEQGFHFREIDESHG